MSEKEVHAYLLARDAVRRIQRVSPLIVPRGAALLASPVALGRAFASDPQQRFEPQVRAAMPGPNGM
jgi:hypothetical protein